tara:strand:+ start:1369 stop:2334 length:966 start_codon:yes stop_codon:yes gene_type:complete
MLCKNIIFIGIIILLLTIIITRKPNLEQFSPMAKIAIVSMVTKHPDFDFWIEYHLNTLGIDHIFLRVEDSPHYKEIIDKYPTKITASYHLKENIDMKHNYLTIMDRQKDNVNAACIKAKNMGIDFLFHCDADELIHVISSKDSIRQNFRRYLNQAKDSESNIKCIHFKNFEAVFPKMTGKCFTTNKFIDCKKGRCLSYANGKSCGLVQRDTKFRGPHYFQGKNYNMTDDKIVILHYDSCTYKQWYTKFNLLKDTNEEKIKKIPFPFYKNSIKKLKECSNSSGDSNISGGKEKICKKYFKEQKIDNYYKLGNKLIEFDAPRV